jgi:hypothetical protein
MPIPITGGCLCGGVRFEVTGAFIRAGHCHCSRCRRHSGTFGLTQGRVRREQFRLLRGEDLVRVYGKGEGAVKAFCSQCGSSLFGGTWPDGPQVSIRLGAIDGDPGIRPQFHTHVESRAPWDEITDDLPRYPGEWSQDAGAAVGATAASGRAGARSALLEEHLRAENAHDVDAIMATFGRGAVLVLNGERFDRPEVIRIAHERLGFAPGGGFSDLRIEEQARYADRGAIVLEQRLTGRHTNSWEGIAPTGRAIELAVCTVYLFDDQDKLALERVYFDRGLLLRQLGVLR